MVAPLTPKPTRKAEALTRAPPTIPSRREEDTELKEVAMLPRYRCASCILETKTTDPPHQPHLDPSALHPLPFCRFLIYSSAKESRSVYNASILFIMKR
jgi:hypothetical protein